MGTFGHHLAGVAAVGVVGAALAWQLAARWGGGAGAPWGVGAAVGSSAVALLLKRWAMSRTVAAALKVAGAVFALRLLGVTAGIGVMLARGVGPMPFVVGFLTAYVVVQWLEISFVLCEHKRRSPGV